MFGSCLTWLERRGCVERVQFTVEGGEERKRLLQLQPAGSPGPRDRPRGMQGLWN